MSLYVYSTETLRTIMIYRQDTYLLVFSYKFQLRHFRFPLLVGIHDKLWICRCVTLTDAVQTFSCKSSSGGYAGLSVLFWAD